MACAIFIKGLGFGHQCTKTSIIKALALATSVLRQVYSFELGSKLQEAAVKTGLNLTG